MDGLADAQGELGEHVVTAVGDGRERASLTSGRGQDPAVAVEELESEDALGGQPERERAAGQLGGGTLGADGGRGPRRGARQFEVGALGTLPGVVGQAYRDDAFGGRVGLDGDQRRVECVAAPLDALDGGVGGETALVEADVADFGGV
ncbi:hypothetical protein EES45_07035 [Streptomyces sp. ADI97-07]|nr:hypothetical protein EES45_07035 [Streptomyces sp. ADI97-07]